MPIAGIGAFRKHTGLSNQSMPHFMDWLPVILMAYVAFLFFDQAFDMSLTMQHSSDLLQCIFAGKPSHFYEFVLEKAKSESYTFADENTTAAAYNIIIYITMAIWILPLYLLNLIFRFSKYVLLLNLAGRILVIALSVLCANILKRLAGKLINDPVKASWTGYFFLTSPIIILCVIIQNQYDIFSVILTLLALFFYFDKKYYRFSALMSVAVCYKLFPLLVFVPLILLAEKRISRLLQYAAISIFPYLATNLICRILDPGYVETQSLLKANYPFFDRIYSAQIAGGQSNISIFLVLVILICVLAYYINPKPNTFTALAFLICSVSYANFFIFVEWHPQWFIIIMPFLTLMIFSMKSFRLGILLEICTSAAYLFAVSIKYLNIHIMENSILVQLTSDRFILSEYPNPFYWFFISHGYSYVLAGSIFVGFLGALILVAFWDFRSVKDDVLDPFNHAVNIERRMLYLRTFTILIYTLPPLIDYFSHPVI